MESGNVLIFVVVSEGLQNDTVFVVNLTSPMCAGRSLELKEEELSTERVAKFQARSTFVLRFKSLREEGRDNESRDLLTLT